MKIETELENIKNGKANIKVHIEHADCVAVNGVHFEAILHAMRDTDEKAFDMAMTHCILNFIRKACDDDCDD